MSDLAPNQSYIQQNQKTKRNSQKIVLEKIDNDNQQCKFFRFPCTTQSIQNKETLKNEKSLLNETEIQLTQSKNLAAKVLPQQKPHNTLTSMNEKSYQKGINLSLTSKKQQTNQKPKNNQQIQTDQKTPQGHSFKIQPEPYIKQNCFPFQNEVKDKLYHQLNPLSIDRNKYGSQEIRIGGEKRIIESRKKQSPSFQIVGLKKSTSNHMRTVSFTKIIPEFSLQQRNSNRKQIIPNSVYKYDYLIDSYRNHQIINNNKNLFISSNLKLQNTTNFNYSNGIQMKAQYQYTPPSILLNCRKTQNIQLNSTFINQNLSINYHILNSSFNQQPRYQHSHEIFNKIQIQKPISNDLQQSTHSTYSQKYKDYMQKALVQIPQIRYVPQQNNICNLMQNVRIEVDSVNQEQNQKNQINLSPRFLKIIPNDHRRQQRKGSYSSSFVVIQSKEKQIESTKKIYLPSNIDTSSITDNVLNNKFDQILRLNESQIQQTIKAQTQGLSLFDNNLIQNLQSQVHTLIQSLNTLLAEQLSLKSEKKQINTQRMNELSQQVQQLQNLKFVSEQRCQQIDCLRSLLKVKLISQQFTRNLDMKDRYLSDQKGWEMYIQRDGDFLQLNQSNDTSETQNEKPEQNHQDQQNNKGTINVPS